MPTTSNMPMPTGAKCLFNVSTEGTSPGMIEREIVRRVEANTGRKSGRWEVNVNVYGVVSGSNASQKAGENNPTANDANANQRRTVETIALSDVPDKLFIVLGGGGAHVSMSEVEPAMVPLMGKISPLRQRVKRLVKGDEYDFEDFCVRVGVSFDRQNSPSGVVVEIEYRPCTYVQQCEAVITELMERIAAPLVPPPQPSPDPAVSAAANKQYIYKAVVLDDKRIRKSDLQPFSNRTTAWLYCTLLGSLSQS